MGSPLEENPTIGREFVVTHFETFLDVSIEDIAALEDEILPPTSSSQSSSYVPSIPELIRNLRDWEEKTSPTLNRRVSDLILQERRHGDTTFEGSFRPTALYTLLQNNEVPLSTLETPPPIPSRSSARPRPLRTLSFHPSYLPTDPHPPSRLPAHIFPNIDEVLWSSSLETMEEEQVEDEETDFDEGSFADYIYEVEEDEAAVTRRLVERAERKVIWAGRWREAERMLEKQRRSRIRKAKRGKMYEKVLGFFGIKYKYKRKQTKFYRRTADGKMYLP